MMKKVEDFENHITDIWGAEGTGYYTKQEDMYFDFFKKMSKFNGGKVLEIGPGTGKFANMLIDNYNVTEYTILDLKKNIQDSQKRFAEIGFNGIFIESKDYKQVFGNKYDLFIANNVISEVPKYYREDIFNNVLVYCQNIFVIDGDRCQDGFNDWLKSSLEDNFGTVLIEETGKSYGRAYSGDGRKRQKLEPGCQSYTGDKDAKDEYIKTESIGKLFDKIDEHLVGDSILDVGCGNGRLNELHVKRFNKIVGVDKFREPNPIYMSDKFEFIKGDMFGYHQKVNVVLFMGTFYLHFNYGYKETLIKAKELGDTIVILDHTNRNTVHENPPGYYDLNMLTRQLNMSIVQTVFQKDGPLGVYVIK
jgi:2-polyprenyl-3-methyl-5-hydroxy-6-metoxy-1,4-benzoquinol methylase